jgi:hypothetical protein
LKRFNAAKRDARIAIDALIATALIARFNSYRQKYQ